MLRLFRNFLCLASVLQVGSAVQAQQPQAKPATAPVAKVSSAGSTKTAKKEPVVVSTKSTATASSTKPSSAKTEPAAAASKSMKTEAATPPLKMGPAKPVKGKTAEKVAQQKHSSLPRPGLVPPPPPDTPTMFAGDGFPPGFGIFDYNNPAALAGRRKDIASQLASAKKMLLDKEQRAKELKEKAVQFEQLFSEGVISRRELESAQKDAASAITELSDAKTQAIAYQNAMSRLDDRMKPKSVAAKKNAKGKIKAATKSLIKVAGTSTTPAKTAVTTSKGSTPLGESAVSTTTAKSAVPAITTTTTTTTTSADSTAQTATKAPPGP